MDTPYATDNLKKQLTLIITLIKVIINPKSFNCNNNMQFWLGQNLPYWKLGNFVTMKKIISVAQYFRNDQSFYLVKIFKANYLHDNEIISHVIDFQALDTVPVYL